MTPALPILPRFNGFLPNQSGRAGLPPPARCPLSPCSTREPSSSAGDTVGRSRRGCGGFWGSPEMGLGLLDLGAASDGIGRHLLYSHLYCCVAFQLGLSHLFLVLMVFSQTFNQNTLENRDGDPPAGVGAGMASWHPPNASSGSVQWGQLFVWSLECMECCKNIKGGGGF